MLRISLLLASASALQAPPRAHRATRLQAAEAALAVDAADAFDQFGVAAVAASAKLASQDPAGEKPSDAQTRGVDFIKGELLKYCAIDRATGLFKIPDHERLCGARIIFCTCATAHLLVEAGIPSVHAPEGVGAGGAPYAGKKLHFTHEGERHFTHIFVDEASPALEPELSLIPL